eukprot:gene44867-55840_t
MSDVLYPLVSGSDIEGVLGKDRSALLQQTKYSQPILVALEYCIAQVWLGRGVKPSVVLGHSLGEYAAAVIAGVMSIDDSLRLVCERACLVDGDENCKGVMMALGTSVSEVEQVLITLSYDDVRHVSIACVNGPRSVVISGSEIVVHKVVGLMEGIPAKRLDVDHAFHSPLMTGMSEKYRQTVSTVTMSIPHIRLISTVTGKEVRDEMMQTQYWIDHILCRVQYQQAIQCAWESGIRVYVEMGPSNTLSQLCRGCIEDQDDHEFVEIVSGLDKSSTRKAVKRYVPPDRPHRMLQRVKRDDFEQRTIFTTYLHSGILKDWLRDHKLFGTVVVPGAALLEMSLSAAKKT